MHSYPTIFEDCKMISIANLRDWGYLYLYQIRSGTLRWAINSQPTGSASIFVDMNPLRPFLQFDYWCDNIHISYRVVLSKIPSNLNKGHVWYFVCPKTGRLCRKLHLVGSYFYHRSAFKGCLYEKQTLSRSTRHLYKTFSTILHHERFYETITTPHFKKVYHGKLTKRYKQLLEKIERNELA